MCVPPCSYPGLQASASYRQLNTIGGCHQYTVSGYSLARNLGCGTRLCSDMFEVAGQLFRIEVYPAGELRVRLAGWLGAQHAAWVLCRASGTSPWRSSVP